MTDKWRTYFDKFFQSLIICAVKNGLLFSIWLYLASSCIFMPLPATLQNIPLWDTLCLKIFRYFWFFFFNGALTETLLAFLKKQKTKNQTKTKTKLRSDLQNRAFELLNTHKKQRTLKTFNTYTNQVCLKNGDSWHHKIYVKHLECHSQRYCRTLNCEAVATRCSLCW